MDIKDLIKIYYICIMMQQTSKMNPFFGAGSFSLCSCSWRMICMTDEEKKIKQKEYYKKWYKENKEYHKKYYEENKEKFKKYYEENKERILLQQKGEDGERGREKNRKYAEKHKDKIAKHRKEYRQQNQDKIKEYAKNYNSLKENKDRHNVRSKESNEDSKTNATSYREEWSYEDVCTLIRLKEQGKSSTEIAEVLGRSIYGVKSKIRRIRHEGHNYNIDQKNV